ncbi:MAG TPA: acyl carrier protein [Bryobacteraceae bacterium]|jgi:acyl carrier protein|nr:acyl carrier protein [Bryobacteraceae bacterium]
MDEQMTASPETLDRIRRVFAESLELNLSEKDLDYAGRLDEVTGLDSAATIVFVAALEKEFGITIEPQKLQLEFITDLHQLASYLERRTGK